MKDRSRHGDAMPRRQRRSIRLQGYDYTRAGAYFITVCTRDRACLFGVVADGQMRLNAWGEIVRREWFKTAQIRPYVRLRDDELVIMPNHVHGIIWIVDDMVVVGAQRRCAPTIIPIVPPTNVVPGSVGAIVRSFKSAVTKRINALQGAPRAAIWQRNYYEHIIRDDESLNRIRQYITENPPRWAFDRENPAATARQQEETWEP